MTTENMIVTRTLLAPTETEGIALAVAAWKAIENCAFVEQIEDAVNDDLPEDYRFARVTATRGKKSFQIRYDYVTERYYITVSHPSAPVAHGKQVWAEKSQTTHLLNSTYQRIYATYDLQTPSEDEKYFICLVPSKSEYYAHRVVAETIGSVTVSARTLEWVSI
jgi:hypothetical protein